jgi:Rrf2 family transcriptional regulator, cysteine metabolism repressor
MFKLSTKIRYGMRAIVRIALESKQGAVSLSGVSRAEGISPKYLEYIVGVLKKSGLVSSVKGPRGGYVLARDAADITLLDVARSFEGEVCMVDCLKNNFRCRRRPRCTTYEVWAELGGVLKRSMESVKLSDLMLQANVRSGKSKKGGYLHIMSGI